MTPVKVKMTAKGPNGLVSELPRCTHSPERCAPTQNTGKRGGASLQMPLPQASLLGPQGPESIVLWEGQIGRLWAFAG